MILIPKLWVQKLEEIWANKSTNKNCGPKRMLIQKNLAKEMSPGQIGSEQMSVQMSQSP